MNGSVFDPVTFILLVAFHDRSDVYAWMTWPGQYHFNNVVRAYNIFTHLYVRFSRSAETTCVMKLLACSIKRHYNLLDIASLTNDNHCDHD